MTGEECRGGIEPLGPQDVDARRRFGEYRATIDGISDRLLTQRLKELEANGLIERTVIPSTPVQIRYDLSADGRALVQALQPLTKWSIQRSARRAR